MTFNLFLLYNYFSKSQMFSGGIVFQEKVLRACEMLDIDIKEIMPRRLEEFSDGGTIAPDIAKVRFEHFAMKRKAKLLAINAQAHALDQAARSPRKGYTTHRQQHSETAMTFLGGTQKPTGGAKFFSALPSPSKNSKGGLGELASVTPHPQAHTRLSSLSPSKPQQHSRVQFYNTSAPKSALSTIQGGGGASSLPDIAASDALLKEMQREKERLHRVCEDTSRAKRGHRKYGVPLE